MSDGPGRPACGDARVAAEMLERAAQAVPAAAEDVSRGCWLRHTDTGSWWAGATLAHGVDPAAPLGVAVTAAEQFYARHRATARFQVCPGCPAGLDGTLAGRGYARTGSISLQTVAAESLAARRSPHDFRLDLRPDPDDAWLGTWLAGTGAHQDQADAQRRMLARVSRTSCYLTLTDTTHRPVAVARAVADTGWTGVFDMTTLPHARRRGAGAELLARIAAWAVEHRVPRLYLQVEHDNQAARRLYESTGFTELAAYHYRVKP